jgi:hypothetical protein
MRYLKIFGLAALPAMALMMSVGGGAALATTLSVGGVNQTGSVNLRWSIKFGLTIKDTSGFSANTCTTSEVAGSTASPFSGTTVTEAVSSLTFSNCSEPVTVHKNGTLHYAYTSGTNGTVSSSGTEFTTDGPFGYLNCTTGTSTTLGTLTGVSSGSATMDLNAVLNCGISVRWSGGFYITSPAGVGVEK